MLPDDTVCSVLGVQPGIAPAAAVGDVPVETEVVGDVDGAVVPPELELPQPASARLDAANAAIPTTTRFTVLPFTGDEPT
jgi:hypothetical protein